MRVQIGTLVATLAILAAAPTAAAQLPQPVADSLAIEVEPYATPIPTETDVEIPYTITYTVASPSRGSIPVALLVDAPAGWLVLAVPEQHATPDAPAIPATYTFEGVLRARHDGSPHAFRADTIRLVVTAAGDGALVQPRDATTELVLQADWEPGLRVVVQGPDVALSRGGSFGLALGEIHNTGNAPVDITATITRTPDPCDASIDRPPTTLGAGERTTLAIDVSCSSAPAPSALVVTLEHALAIDPTRKGEPVAPTWEIGGEGSSGPRIFGDAPRETRYDASWGAVLLVPAALALAAIFSKRRAR